MADVQTPVLTGALLRAARALIEISAAELAAKSGVGQRTILRAEKEDGPVSMRPANAEAIVEVLRSQGVLLIAADEHWGPGLRIVHSIRNEA